MSHIVPVLCLIAVIFFLEMKLGKEVQRIDKDLRSLKRDIEENRDNISKNSESIKKING